MLAIPNGGSNSYLEANSKKLNQFNLKTYSGNDISLGMLFKQLTLSELFLFFDWEAFQIDLIFTTPKGSFNLQF